MTNTDMFIHPTFKDLVDAGKIDRAIATAHAMIDVTNNDQELDPWERASELSESWFQIALLEEMNGNMEAARDAARNAFCHDAWHFEQHPHLVRLLSTSKKVEDNRLAVEIAKQVEFSEDSGINSHDLKEIKNIILSTSEHSNEMFWRVKGYEFKHAFEDADEISDAFLSKWRSVMEEGQKNGWPREDVDAAYSALLYYGDQEDDMLQYFEGYDFSGDWFDIPMYVTICSEYLNKNKHLPDPLTYPTVSESQESELWLDGAQSIRNTYATYEAILSTFDNQTTNDEDEDEDERDFTENKEEIENILSQLVIWGRRVTELGIQAVDKFLEGEYDGGYLTKKEFYIDLHKEREFFISQDKSLTEKEKEELKYNDLEKLLNIIQSPDIACELVEAQLNRGAFDEAGDILDRLIDCYNELSFRLRYTVDTLKVSLDAYTSDLSEFHCSLLEHLKKYKDFNRLVTFRDLPLMGWCSGLHNVYFAYLDTYLSNNETFLKAVTYLREKHPNNIDILQIYLSSFRRQVSGYSVEFSEEIKDYLPSMKASAVDDHGRMRYFMTLLSFGNILLKVYCNKLRIQNDNDVAILEEARTLLEEAAEFPFDSVKSSISEDLSKVYWGEVYLFLADIYYLKEEYNIAKKYSSEAISLLETPYNIDDDDLDDLEYLDDLDLSRCPNLLLAEAYFLRGVCKSFLESELNDIVDDHRSSLDITYGAFENWSRIAKAYFKEWKITENSEYEEPLIEAADEYLNRCDDLTNCDAKEVSIILATVYLHRHEIEDALEIVNELKEYFPEDEEVVELDRLLASAL